MMVGELTLDDVVFEDEGCQWKLLGGGALYSAIGAMVWGAETALNAVIGNDYPEHQLRRLEDEGIDLTGVIRIDRPSLGVWLLNERGGRRHQVEKASASSFQTLDEARPALAISSDRTDGIHVAPQTTAGQIRALADASALTTTITQDLLVEPFIDPEPYRDGTAIRGTTAFLPSEQEVRQLWGELDPRHLLQELRTLSKIRFLVIKRGPRGVDVVAPNRVINVPAVALHPLDTTGAGDAFCGGFLAGLLATGDAVEAAVRGSVSAAFVVETRDAIDALDALRELGATAPTRRADRLRRDVKERT